MSEQMDSDSKRLEEIITLLRNEREVKQSDAIKLFFQRATLEQRKVWMNLVRSAVIAGRSGDEAVAIADRIIEILLTREGGVS